MVAILNRMVMVNITKVIFQKRFEKCEEEICVYLSKEHHIEKKLQAQRL